MVQHLLAAATCRVARLDADRPGLSVLSFHRRCIDHARLCTPCRTRRREARPVSQGIQTHGDHFWFRTVPQRLSLLSTFYHSYSGSAATDRDLLPHCFVDLPDDEDQDSTADSVGAAYSLLAGDDSTRRAWICAGRSQQRGKYRIVYRSRDSWTTHLATRQGLRSGRFAQHDSSRCNNAAWCFDRALVAQRALAVRESCGNVCGRRCVRGARL